MNKQIELLINVLKLTADANLRATFLVSFISKYGPIPDEYEDEVEKALAG